MKLIFPKSSFPYPKTVPAQFIPCTVLDSSNNGIASSNPTQGIDIFPRYFAEVYLISFLPVKYQTGNWAEIGRMVETYLAVNCLKPKICLLNPLNPELNPICYLLALLAHHFLHVSRIRVKLLTFRRLMSYIYIYIYMEHPFLMFLDHSQRRSTVGRTPLDE